MGLGWGAVFFRLPVDLEDELLRRAPEEDAVRFPPVDFFGLLPMESILS